MASAPPHVFGFLSAPTRDATLFAISKAVLAVRDSGVTFKDIAKTLGVSDDCIANCVAERTLLNADVMLRLCYFWPDLTGAVRDIISPPPVQQSRDDVIVSIQRQLDGLRGAA